MMEENNCRFFSNVTVAYMNKSKKFPSTPSVYFIKNPRITVKIYGRIINPKPFICLTHGYAIARKVIESLIGECKNLDPQIHAYLNNVSST